MPCGHASIDLTSAGKGNFKPVKKPVRPAKRPAVGPPRPGQSSSQPSQKPTVTQPSQKPTVTQPSQTTPLSQPPAAAGPSQPSQKPQTTQENDAQEKTDEPVVLVPETPNEKTDEVVRKPALGARKVKPLLAAAAAAKSTPPKPSPSAPPPPSLPLEDPPVPTVTAADFPPPPTPAPAPVPVLDPFAPPTVAATEPSIPPSVEAAATAEVPPGVASSSLAPPVVPPAPNTADIASQIVEEIHPFDDHDPLRASSSRRVRTRREPTPAKRIRAIARHRKDRDLDLRSERERTVDTTRSGSVLSTGRSDDEGSVVGTNSPAPRKFRGKYQSRGRSTGERRSTPYRRPKAPQVSHPELDGVEANDLVGGSVNPTVMRLSELATTLVSQGRVSARALKLHDFQRAEDERKRKDRVNKAEENWKRRQIVRRKAREIRNQKREQRRQESGGNAADVSDDSADSDEEFEVIPDRLTPPGSPRRAERVAPVRFEPEEEVAPQEGAEEGVEGDAPARAPADEEDIEGLGFHANYNDEDVEMGEEMEDFQLPVEDDVDDAPQDFSGLGGTDYIGGYLDEETGEWVEGEGRPDLARLQQRQENYRRRIMDGDDDRQVELIDNDTQFVNSATWGKKVANDRWTSEETELFFSVSVDYVFQANSKVLRETGENYTLMKAYFPGRTVRQLKNKGLKENRANPDRMNEAIFNRKPIDTEYLAKASGFNIEDNYDRENAFLKEVAEEKERLALIPLDEPEAEDGEAQPQSDPAWNLEFGNP